MNMNRPTWDGYKFIDPVTKRETWAWVQYKEAMKEYADYLEERLKKLESSSRIIISLSDLEKVMKKHGAIANDWRHFFQDINESDYE